MDFWPDRLCCEWKWFSSDFQHLVVWNKFEMALSSISRRETWSVVRATGDRFPLEVRLSGPFWWGPSVMCDMAGQGVWQLVAAVFQGKQWDQRAAGDQMVARSDQLAGLWGGAAPCCRGQSQSIPGKLGSGPRAGPGVTRLQQLDSGAGDSVTAVKNIIGARG